MRRTNPSSMFPLPLLHKCYALIVMQWHLGAWAQDYLPTARGFHESLAYLCLSGSYDHYTQAGRLYCPGGVDLWLNDGPGRTWNGTYDAEMYSRFAVDVVRRHAQRATDPTGRIAIAPLYLHVEYHVVHEPVQSPPQYQARYPNVTNACRKAYCGMLSALDDGVANVTSALHEGGLYNNSVIIVTTDNGGLVDGNGCGSNFPLRGGKHSFFAGGIQGIALVHSPLLPSAVRNTVFSGLAHASDFYPTLAALAGIQGVQLVDTGPFPVDGIDLWPFLTMQRTGNVHDELLISGCRPGASSCNGAMFLGELKLIMGKQEPSGWYGIPKDMKSNHKNRGGTAIDDCSLAPCVFNMTADPFERHNLAAADPNRFQPLLSRFRELSSVIVHQDPGASECDTAAICNQVSLNAGFFGPWANVSHGGRDERSCSCPAEPGFHLRARSSATVASFAGGDAMMCKRRCCGNADCDGWVFQSYQVDATKVCAQGKSCCYLHGPVEHNAMEPKANCTAGLMRCNATND